MALKKNEPKEPTAPVETQVVDPVTQVADPVAPAPAQVAEPAAVVEPQVVETPVAEPDPVNSVAPVQDPAEVLTPSVIDKDADAEAQAAQANKEALEGAEAEGKPAEGVQLHVPVVNLRNVGFRQHSTGKWIEAKGEAHLLDDGWLESQCKAGMLIRKKDIKD